LAQLIKPIALCNFSKFLSKEVLYEASAILASPSGMKLFGHLHILKSLGYDKFQLKLPPEVIATSRLANLVSFVH
jgi:hypothetical protein